MNMYPNQVNPALALQMGWDPVATNNDDVVTLIRRKVTLEEVVISREKFDQMNQALENDDIEDEQYWTDFDWKDAEWEDFTIENTMYTAWSGDVTSCSDDCVNFYDNQWFESYEPMTLQNS